MHSQAQARCEQKCVNKPGSYVCECVRTPTDWIMMDSHAQARCEQKYVNKQGSCVCECENSYRLDPDGFSCTGKM